MPENAKLTVLSTAHITGEDAARLEANPTISKNAYSFWVYTPLARSEFEGMSQGFFKAIDFAEAQGSVWVLLDCDGPVEDELEVFEW